MVVADAPLCEYEAYEALQRMVEAGWLEFVGRRDPGAPTITVVESPRLAAPHRSIAKEVMVGVSVLAVFAALRWTGQRVDGR